MKVQQLLYEQNQWSLLSDGGVNQPQLVLFFSSAQLCREQDPWQLLHQRFPSACIAGLSTGGEILGDEVFDKSISAVAIEFEHSHIQLVSSTIDDPEQSAQQAQKLVSQLPQQDLKLVWLLSDGMQVNGSELINGCRQILPEDIFLTGGLAGDGADFNHTYVSANGPAQSGQLAAVGFYGPQLEIGWGSMGGWDNFGPKRIVTRSQDNVLYELDGQPALELYKRYLGEDAQHLPGSALLFPLTIQHPDEENTALIRTILSVDESDNSLTFAGNVPQGYMAQLMRGNFDHLIEGAAQAAESANIHTSETSLALLVSCIGRKLLMGQQVADEVEVVADILGPKTKLAGFYSYGEIAPDGFSQRCEFHNQTMTITTISEKTDA